MDYVQFHTLFYLIWKHNPVQYTRLFIIKYMGLYVGMSTSCSSRHIHCAIFILRMKDYIVYICNLFETFQGLFFVLHLKQEHEQRERFLHHLQTYKYSGVYTVIFCWIHFIRLVWVPLHVDNTKCLLWTFSYIVNFCQ